MSEQAYKSLKAALQGAITTFDRMETDDLLRAAIALVEESGVEYAQQETIPAVLRRVAELGSIDAVAIMAVMGCPLAEVTDVLRALAMRSQDVLEGIQQEALVTIFEEWAEEEIVAGRMFKTVCPTTGKTLYGSVEKKP
jgi:hypothetical protein